MGNTRFSGSVISGGALYAAGTTNFNAQAGGAATVLPVGVVKSNQGFVFAAGDAKQFACGTYIGTGAATAAIIATGLTTVHKVFMDYAVAAYGSATTKIGRTVFGPVKASGTAGSFYPLIYRSTGTNKNVTLGTGIAGTFNWMALGALAL